MLLESRMKSLNKIFIAVFFGLLVQGAKGEDSGNKKQSGQSLSAGKLQGVEDLSSFSAPEIKIQKSIMSQEIDGVTRELSACGGKDMTTVEQDLRNWSETLEASKAAKHMDVAKQHIEAGLACAYAADEKINDTSLCVSMNGFKKVSFPKDPANKKRKLAKLACKHRLAVENAYKRANQAYNHIQSGMEWKRGDAIREYEKTYSANGVDKASPVAGLIGLTSGFLNDIGLSEKDLKTCAGSSIEEVRKTVFSEFKNDVNKGLWSPVAISSPRECNERNDGLFLSSPGFFSNFTDEGLGRVNEERLCLDHGGRACFKNLLFKLSCDSIGTAADKKICDYYADKGLDSCLVGNYDEAFYPQVIENYLSQEGGERSTDTSSYLSDIKSKVSALHTLIHTDGLSNGEPSEKDLEAAFGSAQTELGLIAYAKKNKFEDFFDKAYGSCVYMRAAAKKSAEIGGTPNGLIVGEHIQGGRYSCKRVAAWTADFNDCAFKMLYGDGMFDAAAVFGGAGIQVKNAIEQGDVMKKQNSEMMSGSPTAGLNAQKRNLKNQAENQYIQGGLSGSHAIALTASAADFPTPEKLSTACSSPIPKSHFQDEIVNCGVAVVVDRNLGLAPEVFANQEVKEALYYKGAEKLMEAALATLTGLQLDKQAKDINKIKEEYDKFFQDDVAMPTYEPTNYCEANPSAPSCGGSNRVTDSSENFGSIGFQNSGGGNFSFNNAVPDGYTPDEKLTEAEKEARDRLGNIMAPNGSKGNNDFKKVGEASGSSASKVTGGGGGGGGAGGGGGSVASAPKKPESKSNNNFGMKKTSAKRSGGGSVKYQSGGSVAKNKSKNAFDGLLDRGRRRDVATTTLENVSPATSKLFEKISKRYNQVSADKRLYEFESEQ